MCRQKMLSDILHRAQDLRAAVVVRLRLALDLVGPSGPR